MSDRIVPKAAKLPFYAADAVLFGLAWFVYYQSKLPLEFVSQALITACVVLAACLGVLPFVLEYRTATKLAEADALTTVLSHVQHLEKIDGHIREATGQWQNVQTESGKTVAAAKAIAEHISSEAKAFTEFMQRANDSEKAALRLESEKLRRAESEWLQVVVRMLDHVFALHQGALRSTQPALIEQTGHFQNACREVARRVGLVPFAPSQADRFDPARHQLIQGEDGKAAEGAAIAETIASGYTFQGQMLRPALVRLQAANGGQSAESPAVPAATQDQLALGTGAAGPS